MEGKKGEQFRVEAVWTVKTFFSIIQMSSAGDVEIVCWRIEGRVASISEDKRKEKEGKITVKLWKGGKKIKVRYWFGSHCGFFSVRTTATSINLALFQIFRRTSRTIGLQPSGTKFIACLVLPGAGIHLRVHSSWNSGLTHWGFWNFSFFLIFWNRGIEFLWWKKGTSLKTWSCRKEVWRFKKRIKPQ